MQTINKIILIVILLFNLNRIYSDIIDETYLSSDVEEKELSELLESYLNNRIYWKDCGLTDIKQIPLKASIIEPLVKLKKKNIPINSLTDLRSKTALTKAEVRIIGRLIQFREINNFAGEYKFYNKFSVDAENLKYSKNSQKLRITLGNNGFLGGVTEWDEGEINIWDYRNITFRSPRMQKKYRLYAGSYKIKWGYGLVLSNSLFNIMTSDPSLNLKINNPKIYNSTSSSEYSSFFGMAGEIKYRNLMILPFGSRRRLDANIENGIVTSISTTGIHKTSGQIQRKRNLLQAQYGIGTSFKKNNHKLGVLGYYAKWSKPLLKLKGDNIGIISFYHMSSFGPWKVTGEYAGMINGEGSLHSGLVFDPDYVEIGIGYRYLGMNYFSDIAGPLRYYSGDAGNEKALNMSLSIDLPLDMEIGGYIDYFARLRPEDCGNHIPKGTEALLSMYKKFDNDNKIWLKYKRIKNYHKNQSNFQNQIRQIKCKSEIKIVPQISLINRFAYKTVASGNTYFRGFGINNSLELFYDKTIVNIGTAHFYTDNYDARIYLYEPGIPFRFNLPILYGTGSRYFLTINYRINEIFLLYFVCSYRIQRRREEVNWNQKSLFELQLEIDL